MARLRLIAVCREANTRLVRDENGTSEFTHAYGLQKNRLAFRSTGILAGRVVGFQPALLAKLPPARMPPLVRFTQ